MKKLSPAVMAKKSLGAVMILAVFTWALAAMVAQSSWGEVILALGLAILITAFVAIGAMLLLSEE